MEGEGVGGLLLGGVYWQRTSNNNNLEMVLPVFMKNLAETDPLDNGRAFSPSHLLTPQD